MRGVRTAGGGIDHHLGVPVIGRDQHRAAFGANRGFDSTETGIDRFNGFHSRLNLARMPNHIGVGEVYDDDVERSLFSRFHDRIGDASGAHLRLQIVRRNLLRRYEYALFPGEWLLYAAVEKICDVSVFLGLGHTQVAHLLIAHYVGEDVSHRFRGNHDQQAEIFVVLRHADVMEISWNAVAGNGGIEISGAGKVGAARRIQAAIARQRARDLADAVSAKIEADAGVLVANGRERLAAF